MTVVDETTGEIVELDAPAAERRAERIRLRLDAIADNYVAAVRLIVEAIESGDHLALGYRSPGDYLQDRFGGALTGLGIEARRSVVAELTAVGMSTRAIAPVVDVSRQQVGKDRAQVATDAPPVTGVDGKTYTRRTPSGIEVPDGDDPSEYESDCHVDSSGGLNELRELLRRTDRSLANFYAFPSKTQMDLLADWASKHERKTKRVRSKI